MSVTCRDAEQQPQRADGNRHQQYDVKRNARAVHQTTENIAAKLVGTKPVLRIRCGERVVEILHQRVVRRDKRRENRHHQQQENNPAANSGQRIPRHLADKTARTL